METSRLFELDEYAAFMAGDGNEAIIQQLQDPDSEATKHFEGLRLATRLAVDSVKRPKWLGERDGGA